MWYKGPKIHNEEKDIKLTVEEIGIYNQLKDSHKNWLKFGRFFFLIFGIIITSFGFYLSFKMPNEVQGTEHLLLYMKTCFPALFIGGMMASGALHNWHGIPNNTILLKLMEHHMRKEKTQTSDH